MDDVLIDGDIAQFQPTFGAATVVVAPGTLTGSGPATLNGKPVCVAGDEASVSVAGCQYMAGSFSIPGTGTLEIAALGGDQQATKTNSGGAKVLLVGGTFSAKFSVQAPAQQPTSTGPVPDPMNQYSGSGTFTSANQKFKGT